MTRESALPGRKRVLYLVSVAQHGLGGHYHSLAAIAGALIGEKAVRGSIVTIGRKRAPAVTALEREGIRVTHVPFDGLHLPSACRAVHTECRTWRPDVIHAFDEHAFFFARVAAWRLGIGAVLTKCGGPPPPKYYPSATALTVFSMEDLDWFSRRSWPAVFLLPNRVRKFSQHWGLIAELEQKFTSKLRIVRISRIVGHYEKTIADSIRLVVRLRAAGFDVQLMIIGRIYDKDVLRRLQAMGRECVTWVTDERFTGDTKQLIDVADLVVGTGRSLMEAVARGRTALCPVAGLSIPCLVTPANVDTLAKFNFSERGRLATTDEEQFQVLCARLRRGRTDEEVRFLAAMSERFCDIESVIPKYLAIYDQQARRPEKLVFDMLLHALKVTFVFLRQRWRERRRRTA
jgi:hypothetical protein